MLQSNYAMKPHEEALNRLIKNDNGYASHTVHPSQLKIDFFREHLQYYIELGIAYLEKRIKNRFIPSELCSKLDHIRDLQSIGHLINKEISVDILGVEDDDYSKYLIFSDGTHRTITVLSTINRTDRYFDINTAKTDEEIIKWAKKIYKGKLGRIKTKERKPKTTKNGMIILNKNPAKLAPFPEIELESNGED